MPDTCFPSRVFLRLREEKKLWPAPTFKFKGLWIQLSSYFLKSSKLYKQWNGLLHYKCSSLPTLLKFIATIRITCTDLYSHHQTPIFNQTIIWLYAWKVEVWMLMWILHKENTMPSLFLSYQIIIISCSSNSPILFTAAYKIILIGGRQLANGVSSQSGQKLPALWNNWGWTKTHEKETEKV